MTVTVTLDDAGHVASTWAGLCTITGSEVAAGAPAAPLDPVWGHLDALWVCDAISGRRRRELRGAVVSRPTWVLNGIGQLEFTIPTHDPAIAGHLTNTDDDGQVFGTGRLDLLRREVQWWRDGELRWNGIPVAATVNIDGTMTVTCYELNWRLSRLVFGSAERHDLLYGAGQMDTPGLPGWEATGATMVRNTSTKVRGTASMQLSGSGVAQASFVHPSHANAAPVTVYATAMVRVQAGTPKGEALLSINSYDPTVLDPDTGDLVELYPDRDSTMASVTEETVVGGWNRVTVRCLVPPDGAQVRVTLWNSHAGNRYFDDVRALKNDTTGIPSPGDDLAVHIVAILNHANRSRGKSFTGLTPKIRRYTGVTEPLGIRHVEHAQITDVIDTYHRRSDGVDTWVDPRRRWYCIAPRKGTDRTTPLRLQDVGSGGWTHDESERANAVIVLGDGDGVDRPEGYAKLPVPDVGRPGLPGSLKMRLERVYRPALSTPLAALDEVAEQELAEASVPQVQPSPLRVPGSWWGTKVETGDRLLIEATSGLVATESRFRVGTIVHDLVADVLELT